MGSGMMKNGIWLFVLQGVNTILPFLTVPYITRILSSSVYGEFSLALNWIGYLQIIVEYGFLLSGTRKLALQNENERDVYSRVIQSRMLLGCGALVLLGVFVAVLPWESSMKVCMVILFTMVLGTVFQHTWFFQGKQDMKFITMSNVISRLVSTVAIFVCVKSPDDIYLYCLLYSLNFVITGFIGLILVRYRYKIKMRRCRLRELVEELKDGWYVFTSSVMTKLLSGFGVTYLGFIVTKDQVGIYSAIYKIPYLIILVWTPVSQLLFPYVSKKFEQSFRGGVGFVKKLGVPIFGLYSAVCLGFIAFCYPTVNLLFGEEYAVQATLLVPMLTWIIFSILNNFLGIQILVASGHSKEYSRIFFVGTMTLLVLTLVLGYFFTTYGVAWAAMISESLMSLLFAVEILKQLRVKE